MLTNLEKISDKILIKAEADSQGRMYWEFMGRIYVTHRSIWAYETVGNDEDWQTTKQATKPVKAFVYGAGHHYCQLNPDFVRMVVRHHTS